MKYYIYLLALLFNFCFCGCQSSPQGSSQDSHQWDQLLSRTELVQRRVIELLDQIDKALPDSDEYFQLAGRIQTSARWLTEQWDSLINHFSSIWPQEQREQAIRNSDYWSKIEKHYNDLGYSLIHKRIELGLNELHELEMMKLGSMRSLSELKSGGSRP
jgi:hypothetical protein